MSVKKATGKVQRTRFTEAEVAAALGGPVSYLGSGAFGDTWRHGDTAVKIICGQPLPAERLQREVDGLRRVSSPHVVRLIGTGSVTIRGQEWQTLVFQYIDGDDVAKRIEAGRQPSAADAEAFLNGVLTGVADMHGVKTVHRDIKPANIALRGGEWSGPVLLDLGMARGDGEDTITAYGTAVGTVMYMAPEVLQGQPQRDAADLFAVGVTVREVLGGRHPFYDPGVNYTLTQRIARIDAGPRPLPAGFPDHVKEVLDRLTDSRRYIRGSASSSLRLLAREGAAA